MLTEHLYVQGYVLVQEQTRYVAHPAGLLSQRGDKQVQK